MTQTCFCCATRWMFMHGSGFLISCSATQWCDNIVHSVGFCSPTSITPLSPSIKTEMNNFRAGLDVLLFLNNSLSNRGRNMNMGL